MAVMALACALGCGAAPPLGTDGGAGANGGDTGGTTGAGGATGTGGTTDVAGASGGGAGGAGGDASAPGGTGGGAAAGAAGGATGGTGGVSPNGGAGGAATAGPGGMGGASACPTFTAPGGGGAPAVGAPDMGAAVLKPGGTCTSAVGCACKDNAFPHNVGGTEVCVCQVGTPKACATACVDLGTDVDNCGACGHACAAHAACVAGACGAEPQVVVPKPTSSCKGLRLASMPGAIFWTDLGAGKVERLSTVTCALPTTISGAETTAPTLIAVEGGTVFWLDGRTIRKTAGGPVTTVFTSATDVNGLAVSADAATVFFSTENTIMKVAASGGPATLVAFEDDGRPQPQGQPMALGLQGNLLVFPTAIDDNVDIVELGGATARCVASPDDLMPGQMNVACDRVARSQGELNFDAILPNGNTVIWADGSNLKQNDLAPTAGQNNIALGSVGDLETDGGIIRGMALANGVVFLTSYDDQSTTSGYVMKASSSTAETLTPVARNLDGPTSIAVDGGRVFFGTAACEIQALPTN